jgi:hypothetical protein
MRIALLPALLLAGIAHGQVPAGPVDPGFAAFSQVCLAQRTVNFALSEEEGRRLGFKREENTSVVPDELAKRLNIPDEKRTTVNIPPSLAHVVADDPETYSVWYRSEKSFDTLQNVIVGKGKFLTRHRTVPATFCQVLTMADPKRGWAEFASALRDAAYLGETKTFLSGVMRTWLIDLPWAPSHAAIVTIADPNSNGFGTKNDVKATRYTIEVVSKNDLERIIDSLSSETPPI